MTIVALGAALKAGGYSPALPPWGWQRRATTPSTRSRSPRGRSDPEGQALPPLRVDAPGRRAPSRGSLPSLSSEAERSTAVASLFSDVYAASSRQKQAAMWRTISAALDKWGMAPFPASKMTIVALGAALKAGGYASAEDYLVHYRVRCEREGCPFDAAMQRIHLDVARSCIRGGGGPVKALALPLLRLGELDLDRDDPWCPGGPVGPACAMIAGAWLLTREVELVTSRTRSVTLDRGPRGEDLVRWFLPASMTDVEARGVARAHGCICDGGGRASCPFCAVKGQLARLRRLFPDRWSDEGPDLDLPLFPTVRGQRCQRTGWSPPSLRRLAS